MYHNTQLVKQVERIANLLEEQPPLEVLSLVIAAIATGAAAFAAWQAKKAAEETRETRLDEFRPILKWEGGQQNRNGQLVIAVKNFGPGTLFKLETEVNAFIPKSTMGPGDNQDIRIELNNTNLEIMKSRKKLIFKYQDVYSRNFKTLVSLKGLSKKEDVEIEDDFIQEKV